MKIAMLLSGGVDSATALLDIVKDGQDVQAFYLKVWMQDDLGFDDCPWQVDIEYATRVCDQLNVPFQVLSMQREYWDRVVDYTIKQVQNGLTPNPDIMCNRLFKFGAFDEKYGYNFDRIATGHYGRLILDDQQHPHLYLSDDAVKDQTYFLSQMSREQLCKAMFPLGNYRKSEVRDRALKYELAPANRKDSQGICFLGKIDYKQFLSKLVGARKGPIRQLSTQKVLGDHEGHWFYTIGQRSGLRLGQGPWYVVAKSIQDNTVWVAHQSEQVTRNISSVQFNEFNWISGRQDVEGDIQFKYRHSPELLQGQLINQKGHMVVIPDHPLQGIAPGQFLALYRDKECLGSGMIVDTDR